MFKKSESIVQKNIIQEKAVNLLYSYSRILLSWATGCGKTLGAFKMVKKLYEHKPNITGYIVCKESGHIDNLQEDIVTHGMEFINDISKCFLYASLHKNTNGSYVDFIILDECHAITTKRAEHLKKIIGPKTVVIMLSATVDSTNAMLLRSVLSNFHQYDISISQAIELGILPHPVVNIHYFKMNAQQQMEYDSITKTLEGWKEKYEAVDEDGVSIGQEWQKNLWVKTGSIRKRFMAEAKTKIATDIISTSFNGFRYICFTGSKTQCNNLGTLDTIVHSDNKKKINLAIKNQFNNHKIDKLFVVNMMRESMNLVNIEKGLIVQLDSVKLSFIQMLGRVFRSNVPEMHIIVWKDTQDEKYLDNVMKGFNTKYVNNIYH